MAASFVAAATGSTATDTITATIPSASVSGSNHFLHILIVSTVGTSLDALTVNGSAVSRTAHTGSPNLPGDKHWAEYFINAAYSGDVEVIATMGQASTYSMGVALYKDVDQVSPLQAAAVRAAGSTNGPTTVTVNSSDATDLLVNSVVTRTNTTYAIQNGHTADSETINVGAGLGNFFFGHTAGGSNTAMAWSGFNNGYVTWNDWGFALKAAPPAAVTAQSGAGAITVGRGAPLVSATNPAYMTLDVVIR